MTERTDPADDAAFDDEALRWAGDEERGGVAPRRAGGSGSAIEDRARNEATDAGEARDVSAAVQSAVPASPARTLATAVFAVIYLAIVLGWVLSVQRTASGSTDLFVEISWQFGEFLAMTAGVLWFGTVHQVTRDRSTLARIGWWMLGVLVLVPWPLVLVIVAEASA